MPTFPLLLHTITIADTSPSATAELEHYLDITTPSETDNLQHALTVTRNLATANASGWRLVGMKLELDLGTGTMEEIPASQIGGDVRISESLDTYADEINFTILGRTYSPFVSAVMRGKRQLRVTGRLGTSGGNLQERVLFDGYIHQCGFSVDPPGVRVQGYDGATSFVNKRLVYSVDPGSRYTRKYVFNDICSDYSITLGTQDWGSNDGGIIIKPISEGGDVEVLEWLREFVRPIGRVIYFSGGALHVIRPRTASTADRSLTASDMAPGMDVGLPAVTNANVVTYTGIVYEYAQVELGKHTVTERIPSTGTYTPKQATTKQSKTDGATSAVTQNQTAATRTIGEKIVTDTFLDGTLVQRVTERWGWYAPKAARYQQETNGTVGYNQAIDVYLFPDGTWRSQEVETYQKLEIVVETYAYTTAGYLATATIRYFQYRATPKVSGLINTVNPTVLDTWRAVYLTHDGWTWSESAESFSETLPAASLTYTLATEEDGRLLGYTYDQRQYGIQLTERDYADYGVVGIGSPQGCVDEAASFRVVAVGGTLGGSTSASFAFIPYRTAITFALQVTGVNGYAPRTIAAQDAIEARVTAKDAVQIALNGEHYYYQQDEGAETAAELRILAFEELREQGHWPISFGMVEDLTLHKGSTVEIIRPEIGLTSAAAKKFLVWSVDRSFNLGTGRFAMQVGTKYYPPELDTE